MPNIEINIDLDKKCAECGKSGAMDSGICMKCVLPAMQGKPMKSEQGRAMQKRLKVVLKKTSI